MADLHVNVNFAPKFLGKYYFVYELRKVFQNLNLNGPSVHVIDALNQLHATHT